MISFIIPWRSGDSFREESFHYVLKFLDLHFPESQIAIGEDSSTIFNRSKARNNAFKECNNDIICILDADTIVPSESIHQAYIDLKSENTWVIPYQDYFNLTQEFSLDIVKSFEPDKFPAESDFIYDFKILSWAGALFLTKEMYEKVGGYDERFEGWGWEDVAFRIKLDNMIGKHTRCGSYAAHLWHPRDDSDFGTEFELKNRKLFDKEYRRKYGWRDERI